MTKPKRLFRYFSPKASGILTEQKLWFSAPKDFNDIFEIRPRCDIMLTDMMSAHVKREFAFLHPDVQIDWNTYKKNANPFADNLIRRYLATVPDDLQAKFGENYGIACFCENYESILMWGHYTDCHRGFALEFEPEHPMFSAKDFGQVKYSSKRPSMEIKEYWEIMLTKSLEWQYEQEHRLIKPLHELRKGERYPGKQGHYLPLPMEAIKAVFFGCRMSPSDQDKLIAGLSLASAQHIESFVMKAHATDYALVAIPWDD